MDKKELWRACPIFHQRYGVTFSDFTRRLLTKEERTVLAHEGITNFEALNNRRDIFKLKEIRKEKRGYLIALSWYLDEGHNVFHEGKPNVNDRVQWGDFKDFIETVLFENNDWNRIEQCVDLCEESWPFEL